MQLVDHSAAAQSRHLDIGEHEIYLPHFLGRHAQRLRAIGRFENAVSRLRQNALAKFAQSFFVVDQQNGLLACVLAVFEATHLRRFGLRQFALDALLWRFLQWRAGQGHSTGASVQAGRLGQHATTTQ